MPNWGRWQWNEDYGDTSMHGWLYVQGNWTWGIVVTWHIAPAFGTLYWVGTAWVWKNMPVGVYWKHEDMVGLQCNWHVEPWMVHEDFWFQGLLVQGGLPADYYKVSA